MDSKISNDSVTTEGSGDSTPSETAAPVITQQAICSPKDETKKNDHISSSSSEEEPDAPWANPMKKSVCTTDAVHPRLLPDDRKFRCRSCNLETRKERKIQQHFMTPPNLATEKRVLCRVWQEPPDGPKKAIRNHRFECNVPNCDGPSFIYDYRREARLYHDCKAWAKFRSAWDVTASMLSLVTVNTTSSAEDLTSFRRVLASASSGSVSSDTSLSSSLSSSSTSLGLPSNGSTHGML